ncbi:MAG: basic rane protein [Thermomicrobiales bacterium]|nr:basic rane protein [Thermomicrobiales bacterium]
MKQTRQSARFIIAIAMIAVLSLGTVAGVVAQDASPSAGDASPVAGEKVTNVAFITPASRTNLGWDQQGADSIAAVGQKLGITVNIQENGGYDDITPALKDLKDDGAQLIICHGSGYSSTCADFANQEQTRVAVIEFEDAVTPNLISDVETLAQEVAYLAGVLAGKQTKSGTVAVVVSGEPPTWNYMTVGFAEGLKASNATAKLVYSVIGDAAYDDAAGAKRVTEQVLAAGADIVFGMGDGASFGMIEAVREHNGKSENADKQAWFIDVIGDKSKDYSDVLLTSALFDYSRIYEEMIKDIEDGTFGKVYSMDVKNNDVRLLDLPASVPQDVKDAVAKAQTDVVSGTIKVSAIGDAEGMKAKLKELGY